MPQLSDESLCETLSTYAGLVSRVLDDPERWLGWGGGEPRSSLPGRVGDRAARAVLGGTPPGSDRWPTLPVDERAEWWVDRIAVVAGFVAATPRFFGAAADRLPVQAAFGASAQGLAICAVAREHGLEDPDDWVPLLGRVLFDRRVERGHCADAVGRWSRRRAGEGGALMVVDDGTAVEPLAQLDAAEELEALEREVPEEPADRPHPVKRAARTLWRLGKTFLAVQGMFDERPRGALPFRALGKVPVVGLVGGWLDERGGVRKAAKRTAKLLG
ncbi:hypothetical protein [Motilibacter aurantiacus]|uniref:hypothetical protein n=1 Tax=Motilibacter aurantiacus TaxID=2714955 RepID=UPI00140A780B|nr:hypothetical protein [Motilibacter aurantiacus]NHC46591.1 hypothetical protein [Motilibacter aurantiacus]